MRDCASLPKAIRLTALSSRAISRSLIVPIWLRACSSLLSRRSAFLFTIGAQQSFYRKGRDGRKVNRAIEKNKSHHGDAEKTKPGRYYPPLPPFLRVSK